MSLVFLKINNILNEINILKTTQVIIKQVAFRFYGPNQKL